ncbi:MAG: caspase family protein [Pseudomonadales bacterium]|nr:caspase family protein [Pseudomonadales bacterium]
MIALTRLIMICLMSAVFFGCSSVAVNNILEASSEAANTLADTITTLSSGKGDAQPNESSDSPKSTRRAKLSKNSKRRKSAFTYTKNPNINDNSYALIIGINEYKQNTNVMYADSSAQSFYQLANTTFGIPEKNILTLYNDEASSGQLKYKIETLRELAENDSKIYLYFAGHGVPGKDGDTYLLPADMSADAIYLEPNLKLSNIYKKLSSSSASSVFVFIDSCFSGKDDEGNLLYKGVAPVLKVKKEKVDSRKLAVFTAGKSNEFANDFQDKGHRLFSYYLIDQLSKGTKQLDTIYQSVRRSVKRDSIKKGLGYKQEPQIYGNTSHDIF